MELRARARRKLPAEDWDWVNTLVDAVEEAAVGRSLAGCEAIRAQAYTGTVSNARAALENAVNGVPQLTIEREAPKEETDGQRQRDSVPGKADSPGSTRAGKAGRKR